MDRLTTERVARARAAGDGVVLTTPVIPSVELGGLPGFGDHPILLKAENLQRTGSFKLRGAMAKLAALGPDADGGVIAGSAGNHARAVAFAARERGVPCTIHMPAGASITKAEACVALGAEVVLDGDSVEAAVAAARDDAARSGRPFIHPYADLDVIAGQATLGSELLDQVPDIGTVVVPLGGGGLAAGVGWALRAARPHVRVVGVQAQACAPWPAILAAAGPPSASAGRRPIRTLADGIAVTEPDPATHPMVREVVDEICVVDEDAIADAVVWLFETTKLVVEGAGAVAVAALRTGLVEPIGSGSVAVVLSGGNIDPGTLGDAIRRHETRAGRRLLVRARLDDRPGSLAALCQVLADGGANVVDIQHVREGIELHFGQTGVQIVAQVRSRAHGLQVVADADAAGFDIEPLHTWPA